MGLTPEQEARYALNNGVARSGLSMGGQLAYDELRAQWAARGQLPGPPDAAFPALGIQVRGENVEVHDVARVLGPLAGAQAQLTDGSQAWSPGRAMFLPAGLAGLATKTRATAFVVFADGTYRETPLNGNAAVRQAQAEAVKFNLMAKPSSTPVALQQEDTAATLRKLASLHDEGLLSDEEYAAKRAEVIARI